MFTYHIGTFDKIDLIKKVNPFFSLKVRTDGEVSQKGEGPPDMFRSAARKEGDQTYQQWLVCDGYRDRRSRSGYKSVL